MIGAMIGPLTTRSRAAALAAGLACAASALLAIGPATAAPMAAPACTADDLSARQTGSAAGMSQPAALITVTNTGEATCTLKGYPTVTGAWSRTGRLSIDAERGMLMNAPPATPRTIRLDPGDQAWFGVGTATAYDPPIRTIVRLAFSPAPGAGTLSVRVVLQATALTGQPIPVTVAPYAPGRGTL
jgi:hypothetical protein